MLTLLVIQGPDKGRRFELPDSITLQRSEPLLRALEETPGATSVKAE